MRVTRTIAAALVSLSLAPVAALAQSPAPTVSPNTVQAPAVPAPVVEKKAEKAVEKKAEKTDVKAAEPAKANAAEGSAVKK